MKLELKKIKFYESLSQETNCFTAELFCNEEHVASCDNNGCGGNTNIRRLEGKMDLINTLEEWCKKQPQVEYNFDDLKPFKIDYSLEIFVDGEVDKFIEAKEKIKFQKKLDRDCLRGICVSVPNGYSITKWNKNIIEMLDSENGRAVLTKKIISLENEGKIILNKNLKGLYVNKI